MPNARVKLAIGSVGGLAAASLLGVGLANYAQSGAFEFYKQPRMSVWEPASADSGPPAPEILYAVGDPVYSPAAPPQIGKLYPVSDYVAFEPQPALETAALDGIGADMRDWKHAPPEVVTETVRNVPRPPDAEVRQDAETVPADDGPGAAETPDAARDGDQSGGIQLQSGDALETPADD